MTYLVITFHMQQNTVLFNLVSKSTQTKRDQRRPSLYLTQPVGVHLQEHFAQALSAPC